MFLCTISGGVQGSALYTRRRAEADRNYEGARRHDMTTWPKSFLLWLWMEVASSRGRILMWGQSLVARLQPHRENSGAVDGRFVHPLRHRI